MKILLLGEFSGLHKNLKEGLVALGHDVTIASSGDGWKKIEADIRFDSKRKGIIGKIEKLFRSIFTIRKLTDYDVVQCISPVIFPTQLGFNKFIMNYIFKNNDKVFLVAAGATPQTTAVADFCENDFKYKELYREIKKVNPKMWSQTKDGREYNDWFLSRVNGVIPIMYEYAQGFRNINYHKLCPTIPIPMNIDKIHYKNNIIKDKVIFFHGLNNEGIKGTSLIKKAMEKLELNYPDDVEIIIDGKMPLEEYLNLLEKVNVVVDQAYYVSYAVNAIYNLAMGKVVVGGGELECLKEFNLKESPLYPIKPTVEDIYLKLESILKSKNTFEDISLASRKFVEETHDYKKIAQMYLDTWSKM